MISDLFLELDLLDLRTQLSQQTMDRRFIGMIVSCFNTDSDLVKKQEKKQVSNMETHCNHTV